MALRLKTEKNLSNAFRKDRPKEEEFNYINLVAWVSYLRSGGFFYSREWTCDDETLGSRSLWKKDEKWLEKVITQKWLNTSLEELSMEFVHFLTDKKVFLHVVWESYGYKEGGRTKLFASSRQFIQHENFFVANSEEPCFHKLLCNCDVYEGSNVLRRIEESAFRRETESFFSALYMNQYRQTGVAKITVDSKKERKLYWTGEFVKKDVKPKEVEYLYLAQIQKDVVCSVGNNGGRIARYFVEPALYMLKSKVRMEKICLEDGMEIILQPMVWQNRPFYNYFDLPQEGDVVFRLEQKVVQSKQKDLQVLLGELRAEGYEYRREQVWEASEKEKEEMEVLGAEIGFEPEYVECGLAKIQMEFVNPQTGDRKYVVIEPEKIIVYLYNGNCDDYGSELCTAYFRADRSVYSRFFGEEKNSPFMEELVLSEPICRTLLEKYGLISTEQLTICNLAGQREYQDWFEMKDVIPCIVDEEEKMDMVFRQAEQSKAAKARRIARWLKYQLLEECEMDGRKVEIYVNEQRSRAIYLIDNGVTYHVRFVDMYMDVNAALS